MGTKHFNSHTREGVTQLADGQGMGNEYFNSHTREGVTMVLVRRSPALHFNSHTREGVTQFILV